MERRRRKLIEEFNEANVLKLASGGGGASGGGRGRRGSGGTGGGGGGFRAGESVTCTVVASEPGGYSLLVEKGTICDGFLPTQALLRKGERIQAQFVCVHRNRLLFSARFSNSRPSTSE